MWQRERVMEPRFDCRACGACCRDAEDGRVLVSADDLVRWRRAGRADLEAGLVPGHFGEKGMPARADGSCAQLGTEQSLLDCAIYDVRGGVCRALEPGSPQCLDYRRRARVDAPHIV